MKRLFALTLLATALSASVIHAQEADLLVLKTGPEEAPAGANVTYEVTLVNLGPDDAATVTLTDTIPAGMTFASETHDAAFSCATPAIGVGGTIVCTAPLLAAGDSASFTFELTIDPGAAPGTTFLNSATGQSATFDPNDENDTGVAGTSTPPPPRSDMAVNKTGPSSAGPDTDLTYTISVTNGGADPGENVTVSDILPGNLTFVSLGQTGTAMSCTTPAVGSGGTITCDLAAFPAGGTTTFTLVAHVPPGTSSGTTYTNTADVKADNDQTEENDSSTISTSVSGVDLSTTKAGPATATAGLPIAYTITVANAGPDAASNVQLLDVLPPNTTFTSVTHDSGVPTSCSSPPVDANGPVECIFVTLASGSSSQFTLTITPGNTTSITNTSSVTSDSFDTDTDDNQSSVSTSVAPSADMAIAKTGPASVDAGANIAYTIVASNDGPSDATNVSFSDPLPPNTTFVSLDQASGPTFSCTMPPVGAAGTIACDLATMPPDTSATFSLVLHVASSATGSIDNTANVSSDTSDPLSGDHDSTTSATITVSADVAVTKSGPATAFAGSNVTYTVTVTNNGPSDASAVSLNDLLPPETTFVSLDQTGPSFTCITPDVDATGTITCNVATLTGGASTTFDIVVHIPPQFAGPITNGADVSTTTADPTPANDADEVTTSVSVQPTDIGVTKTASGPFIANGIITYTIVVTNHGPGVASNVVVIDELPAGTTLLSSSSTQGTCSGTSTVTCTVGILNAGTDATISLEVRLPSTVGAVSNTATATLAEPDTNPANDAGTFANAITPPIPTLSPLALALLALAMMAVVLRMLR